MGPVISIGMIGALLLSASPVASVDRVQLHHVEATVAPRAAAGAAAAAAEVDANQLAAIERKIANFVETFYLSGAMLSDDEIRQLYAPRVEYFSDKVLSPSQIVTDKRYYYKRWPVRRYKLLPDTLNVTSPPDQPSVFNVSFDYIFDVARGADTARGRGRAHLTLDLRLEGGLITRETGRVLERWRK